MLYAVKVTCSSGSTWWEKSTAATVGRAISNVRFRTEGRCRGYNTYVAIPYEQYAVIAKKKTTQMTPPKKRVFVQMELF